MKYAFVTQKYVITNAERTKYFAFSRDHHYSKFKNNPVEAEIFETPEDAATVIEQGKEGIWGVVNSEQLVDIVPIQMSAMIELPGPIPTPKELAPGDIDLALEVAQFVLENEETRQTVGALLDVADEELIRLKKELYVYLMGMVETKLPEEPVETNAE